MTAVGRLLSAGRPAELRALSASGQLGYGIPEPALKAGLAREPHFVGCDMGSIDPGPYYLGAGKPATSDVVTRRDLRLVMNGAIRKGLPLLIGTAGTAGARPHLDYTLDLMRAIAREDGLSFRLAIVPADIPRDMIKAAIRAGRTRPLGPIAPLDEATVDRATHIVGQMGLSAFRRALEAEPDVILTGRACDTAVFASIPLMLGLPTGPVMHMSKIIECTSLCCVPGGRDAMLATIEGGSFVLESMNPSRAATPMSVAAHSLYEQSDPLHVYEPEGMLSVADARFEALDARRTRVSGATWQDAEQQTIKLEGAEFCGERAVMVAGSADPRVIANVDAIIAGVRANVADIIPSQDGARYDLIFHVYGTGGVSLFPNATVKPATPSEIFFLVEVIADSADLAKAAAGVTKQYLLHHGFPGRLSTGGNIAFPFTPPELAGGGAYRFSVHHLIEVDDDAALFPVHIEDIG